MYSGCVPTVSYPEIIQGGMGMGVSSWSLANAVARLGYLGVVSGAGLNVIFARRLQEGDIGGHLRRALESFPVPEIARRVLDRYFISGGKRHDAPYATVPMFSEKTGLEAVRQAVVANFAEVTLAKEGHSGPVGINLLEKAQFGNLAALYGAMLAGVDYVLMGAGIPREIPGALDSLAAQESTSLKLDVIGAAPDDDYRIHFDPATVLGIKLPRLKRPKFLAIISSATLALSLSKKATGEVNGFVVEGPRAGGHNAPPRGSMQLNEKNEPVYGARDAVDLAAIRKIGLPFWLAGEYGMPGKLHEARAAGAAGIQVGTAFAFCRESGLSEEIKSEVINQAREGRVDVLTDALASPTALPFKVVDVPGSVSQPEVYAARPRVCDIGYLRRPYKREDGTLGYRCAAEPVEHYVRKGGKTEDTVGRKCLCNGLIANLGLGYDEPPIVTAGDMVIQIPMFLPDGADSYGAADVVAKLVE
jgi:nitronate monooxygenase